jgi:hypothetical protein
MAIPSRKQQAQIFAGWLEEGAESGESLIKFSERVVDAFHEMLTSNLKGRSEFPEVGTAFKSSVLPGVQWVAWGDDTRVWLTSDGCNYGNMVGKDDTLFEYVTPSSAKVGKPGSNEEWAVDDQVSSFQGAYRFKVIAVHSRGVLLERREHGHLIQESNTSMAKYYTKEK